MLPLLSSALEVTKDGTKGPFKVVFKQDFKAGNWIGMEQPATFLASDQLSVSEMIAAMLQELCGDDGKTDFFGKNKMTMKATANACDVEVMATKSLGLLQYLQVAALLKWKNALELSMMFRKYSHNCVTTRGMRHFGLAVHALFGMINHSCRPNTNHFFFVGGLVALRTVCDVKAGEEVCVCVCVCVCVRVQTRHRLPSATNHRWACVVPKPFIYLKKMAKTTSSANAKRSA